MPTFVYTARDRTGTLSTGSIEADSNSSAAASLRSRGLWVTDLRESRPAPGVALPRERRPAQATLLQRLRPPVSPRDLSIFYRQLHTLLHSGVPFYQSLDLLAQRGQSPNPHLRRIAAELAGHLLRGGSFSGGMALFPAVFDRMQIRLVEAGESGGLLSEIFRRLAEYLEREHEVRQEVKRKTLYPRLVLGLLLLVLPIQVPITLAGYLSALVRILGYAGAVLGTLWLVSRGFGTSRAGREIWDQVKLAIPITGPLVRKMAAARFARTLAALYGAGVPIGSSLAMAGESCGNHVLEEQATRMVPALERGASIAQTLQATRFFPPMFIGMVSTGESTGNLDQMLEKAAEFYEQEASHATTQLVVTLGVLLLIGAAILVALKLISFYAGMYGGLVGGEGFPSLPGGAGGD